MNFQKEIALLEAELLTVEYELTAALEAHNRTRMFLLGKIEILKELQSRDKDEVREQVKESQAALGSMLTKAFEDSVPRCSDCDCGKASGCGS